MIAVSGDHEALLHLNEQLLFLHEAADFLVIDLDAFAMQMRGHPAIAIAGRFQSDAVQTLAQGQVPLLRGGGRTPCLFGIPVVGGTGDACQSAFTRKWEHLGSLLDLLDHGSPLCTSLDEFGWLGGVCSVC